MFSYSNEIYREKKSLIKLMFDMFALKELIWCRLMNAQTIVSNLKG